MQMSLSILLLFVYLYTFVCMYIITCVCACVCVCVYSTTTATEVPFRLLLVAFTSFFLSFCYSSPPTVSFICAAAVFLVAFLGVVSQSALSMLLLLWLLLLPLLRLLLLLRWLHLISILKTNILNCIYICTQITLNLFAYAYVHHLC